MEKLTCCFTGHRPSKFSFGNDELSKECLEIKARLHTEILNMITNQGVTHFITGMALGTDTWAAEAVLDLKEEFPDIHLIAAIPCPEQASRWSRENQARYEYILNMCDDVCVISKSMTYNCMMKRNIYMVDNSDFVITVWNGLYASGTGKTVAYAKKNNKKIIVIPC